MTNHLESLDRQVLQYCEKNRIMGILRVTCRDQVLYTRSIGWADMENRIPLSKRSMFTFYSLSKPFCAMGLLKLQDRGLVDLDAHPGVYVPEAQGFDSGVTIRQMLHHTSGLPDGERIPEFRQRYGPGYSHKAREHVRLLTRYPSFFPPGTAGLYANINFLLCALIIENVTGESYEAYLCREVLTPSPLSGMGMGCTVSIWHGKRRITHNGGSTGFRTLHIWLPDDDFDIVFLSNSGFGDARVDLSEMLYRHFYEDCSAPGVRIEMDAGYIPEV